MPRRDQASVGRFRKNGTVAERTAADGGALGGAQLAELRPGTPDPTSVSLVIGPGTGLGVGAFVPAGHGAWAVISGEGGHVGFAPNTDQEVRLWQRMREKYGRVSAERVLNEERGRVKKAAKRLGIPRSSLYQKIKKHQIVMSKV